MKKIFLSVVLFSSLASYTQELTENDALRYAQTDLNGTARFRAMGGAFGAVGADLSATNVNPAGSALFINNYVSISVANYNSKNKANYFGSKTNENSSTLDLNQVGGVFVFNAANQENDWNKIAVSINYENTRDFDNEVFIAGANPSNSISQYFVNHANYIANTDFNDYQYEMGYETFVINQASNGMFISNVPLGSYTQYNAISEAGYNGKLTANLATSYKNKLFLGINLNAHFTDYTKTTKLIETNSNASNPTSQPSVRDMQFNNNLSTYGSGFSFNLGAIYKVTEDFRIGASYLSPTWYRLNDELTQDLYTFNNENVSAGMENRYYEGPLFIFPTYKLQTPSKWTASAAYIFGNNGLLSVDVATKNYSGIEFRPKNEAVYHDLNSGISNYLTNALEVRVGGEYKIKKWSLRAGYRFEESPYKNGKTIGDLTNYNCGLGYNFGISRLDLAYSNLQREYNQYLISSGMNDTARIKNTQNNFTLTYSVNF
ncbi:OmpP1/FadL family transporter [Flavobacterium sp.]|uniref:OmpP1/FadL family transporter n=1 Tax=Flavobacterium sp. TaxID=239 RepID=UPI003529BC7B